MKNEFIEFLNALMEAAPEVVNELMTDNVKSYIDALNEVKEKPVITDNGKVVLKYMQDNFENQPWKSKTIADGLFISSRTVSGTMRKLVNDGFCEKIGKDPILYTLTEKGKDFNIE